MADGTSELQIVISALDNATATLKSIASNTETMSSTVDSGTQKVGISFDGLVEHILASAVAYRVLIGAMTEVEDFFTNSIQSALTLSETMAQVKVDVDNAGLSYSQFGPQIDAVAQSNVNLGFTQNDTELSMGKLILATGSFSQALSLNALAMDLSRAKGIDLNSSTVLIEQVMAGNTRALKQYGISLDSATTSAQALTILHDKLAGSATAFASSVGGAGVVVQAQWEEIQTQFGQELMPLVESFFESFERNMPEIESATKEFAQAIILVSGAVYDSIPFIETLVATLIAYKAVTIAIAGYTAINEAFLAMSVAEATATSATALLGSALTAMGGPVMLIAAEVGYFAVQISNAYAGLKSDEADAAASTSALTAQEQKLVDAYNAVHKSAVTVDQIFQGSKVNTALVKEAYADLQKQTAATGGGLDDVANHINAANNAVVKHDDAVTKLSTDYDKMTASGASDLASLADAFTSKMDTINKAILATNQQITDLTASYTKTQQDDTTSVAEAIVASAQKVTDLKAQLAAATTDDERTNLQTQLTAEQANYASSESFIEAHQDAIAAAQARANETDLQRTIDDYNAKQALDKADYQKKLATLSQELADKVAEGAAETKLYNDKVATINKILDGANAYFKQLSNDRLSTTTNEVSAEIAQFQALSAAISQVKAASQTALSTISIPSLPGIPKFAAGGIVTSPTLAIVGEAGPEMIIPMSSLGGASPGGSVGGVMGPGGSIINIYLSGTFNSDRKSASDMANLIARQIQQQLKLRAYV